MRIFSREKRVISDGRAARVRFRARFAHTFGVYFTPMRTNSCARLTHAHNIERKTSDFGWARRASPISHTFCTYFSRAFRTHAHRIVRKRANAPEFARKTSDFGWARRASPVSHTFCTYFSRAFRTHAARRNSWSAEVHDILFRILELEGHEPAGLGAATSTKPRASGCDRRGWLCRALAVKPAISF